MLRPPQKTMPPLPPPPSAPKPRKLSNGTNPNPNPNCKHSPSQTLDILILILVLFSCTFLITSYFSYIFHSLAQILPSLLLSHSAAFRQSPFPYVIGFAVFFSVSVVGVEMCCSVRGRKCEKVGCRGLKKAMEFDLQLQTEECLKGGAKEIDRLPWKGGTEGNPDYECLRSELKRMAPPNGRAVLLFRKKCGCPVAKLEAWGPKQRTRRGKKSANNFPLDGGGGHH